MGLFAKTFETRAVNGYSNEEFARLLGINVLDVGKDKLSEITYFTCCRLLSESVAKLGLKLYRETEKGTVKAVDHYLYPILKTRPNPYMSSWNFWATVELNKNHFGNCFVYIDTYRGKVKGLYILPTDKVAIWIDDAGMIDKENAIWYVYTSKDGKEHKIQHQQVLHFKTSVSIDGITGLSVQDCLKISVENAQSGQKFINNYFKNGLFAKALLQYTGEIAPENMKKMQGKFETMANGLANTGRILPVPLGFSFQTINNSMADSQFLELNRYQAQQIAAAFGIKPNQLNEQGKYNNLEMQQQEFYMDTLLSTLTMYEHELAKLLTQADLKQGLFAKFNVDSVLRASFRDRMDGYATAINNGVMTPNEARAKEDLPIDEHGHSLIVNGNYIPLSMVGQQWTGKGGGQGNE